MVAVCTVRGDVRPLVLLLLPTVRTVRGDARPLVLLPTVRTVRGDARPLVVLLPAVRTLVLYLVMPDPWWCCCPLSVLYY